MKRALPALALAALLLGAGTAPSAPSGAAGLFEARLEGKYTEGMCLTYAVALWERLTLAGQPAAVVVYRWQTAREQGAHAVVVVPGGASGFRAVDNLLARPVAVRGRTPEQWAASFAGPGVSTRVLTVKSNEAELARRAGASALLASR